MKNNEQAIICQTMAFINIGNKNKKELIKFLMGRGLARRKANNLITNYSGVFWNFRRIVRNKREYFCVKNGDFSPPENCGFWLNW